MEPKAHPIHRLYTPSVLITTSAPRHAVALKRLSATADMIGASQIQRNAGITLDANNSRCV